MHMGAEACSASSVTVGIVPLGAPVLSRLGGASQGAELRFEGVVTGFPGDKERQTKRDRAAATKIGMHRGTKAQRHADLVLSIGTAIITSCVEGRAFRHGCGHTVARSLPSAVESNSVRTPVSTHGPDEVPQGTLASAHRRNL